MNITKKRLTIRPTTKYPHMWWVLSKDGMHSTIVSVRDMDKANGKLHHLARWYHDRGMPCNTRSILNVLLN